MRITGGTLCGRTVVCPPGIIRPAMDRMRESLFAVLGDLTGLSFLDLFSGSGVIGLEAYSRGATVVRCVEMDNGKRTVIGKNLAMAEGSAHLSIMPVERFIMAWKEPFNIIFLDPPFDYPHKEELLQRICSSKLLAPWTMVLMHFPDENKIPASISAKGPKAASLPRLEQKDRRVYGRSIVQFYEVIRPETPELEPSSVDAPTPESEPAEE